MAASVRLLDRKLSMPWEPELAPCGWRCPHRHPNLMGPFGLLVNRVPWEPVGNLPMLKAIVDKSAWCNKSMESIP